MEINIISTQSNHRPDHAAKAYATEDFSSSQKPNTIPTNISRHTGLICTCDLKFTAFQQNFINKTIQV